jgi:uncharacterized protein (TIGR02147 family)
VFEHLDYRIWLREAWTALRARSRTHSYRWFSRKAGLGSPSYLKHVLDGDRNLTEDTARRVATGFDLSPQETRFFVALVRLAQARTTEDRAARYEELSRIPRYRSTNRLQRSQYAYYARWYCVPVRELVARADFDEDPAWIAAALRPPIKPHEAAEALEILLELGLLVRVDGRLQQADTLLSTGPELRILSLRRFHQQMLRRAEEAMDEVPVGEREVGGVTVRLTQPQVELLRRRMFEVRQEVLQLDGADEGAQAVHHFAFQLFPVTDWSPEPR